MSCITAGMDNKQHFLEEWLRSRLQHAQVGLLEVWYGKETWRSSVVWAAKIRDPKCYFPLATLVNDKLQAPLLRQGYVAGRCVGVCWSSEFTTSAGLKHSVRDVHASMSCPSQSSCHGAGLAGLGRSLPARRVRQPSAVRASLHGAEEPLRQAAQALAGSTCASCKPCIAPCLPLSQPAASDPWS